VNELQARAIQVQIEDILKKHEIHFKTEYVSNPKLKFINITISIKVTKE